MHSPAALSWVILACCVAVPGLAQEPEELPAPARASPEELDALPADLRSLVVYEPMDADLARLGRFGRLEELTLERHPGSSRRLPVIVTDAGMRHVAAGLTKLRVLRLHGCRNLTGRGLAELEALPVLQELSLRGSAFADEDLAALERLPALRRLSLVGVPNLGDAGLAHVARVAGLQELDLQRQTWLTPDGLVRLAALEQLVWIDLNEVGGWRLSSRVPPPEHATAGVDDRVLEALGKLPRLEVLRISQADKVTGKGVGHLRGLRTLRELDLSYNPNVTDPDLMAIQGPLEVLVLDYCPRVTGHALHLFGDLRVLSLEGCTALEDGALDEMTAEGLRELDLRYCCQLAGEIVRALPFFHRLERLDFGKCEWVRDEHLRTVARLPELRVLSLDGCKAVTDAGLAHLRGLEHLADLDLRANPNVTADGLLELEAPPLRRLTVAACPRIDDGDLTRLRARWPDGAIVR